jgi:hypothetical protein
MPQRSKVLTLPDEIKRELDKRLVANSFRDYAALAEWLKENGFEISRSSVQRYGQEFEERLAAIKIATDQAQAIAEAAGDDQGAMSDALVRLCQEKAFQVLVKMQDITPENVDINKVGLMVSRLTRASVAQKKWMAEVKEKTVKVAGEVKKVARAGGLTEKKAEEIRRKILGIV